MADYNFSLEYQKGQDNTVADFLSHMENCLPEEEVEEALCRVEILAPGVEAMLDNADTPITERAEGGDDAFLIRACLAETLSACPVKYTTLQVVDWKKTQREKSCPQDSGQKFEILKGRFHEGYVQSPQPQSCPGL